MLRLSRDDRMSARMGWEHDDGDSLGTAGEDGGIIVADFAHDLGARMTLEALGDGTSFAMTCGIYGWFFHTRFFDSRETADRASADMQAALDVILQTYPEKDDPDYDAKEAAFGEAISRFVDAYP